MSQPSPSESESTSEDGQETAWPSERMQARRRDAGENPDHSEAAGTTEANLDTENGTDGDGATEPSTVRTLFLDSEDTDELISSLASGTARSILVELHETPSTASEVATAVDTSVQNVRHHLDNLTDAGLVHVAETRYSTKGREMDVYAPVDEQLVVFVGSERTDDAGFVDSLRRFLGAVVLLGATSFVLQWLLWTTAAGPAGGVVRVPDGLGGTTGGLGVPAGVLFFAGGAFVLAVVSVWRSRRRGR